ncbi:MAG: flavodoxin family protein, partial [Anaerolineaceae bacterium]|nr:flavodoxin family protein [Anaerolineaceae bacterium]
MMPNVIVINGSPRKSKGHTAFVTQPFVKGMQEAGAKVDLYYVNDLNIKPCECGVMYCWTKTPGKCIYKDDMTMMYEKFKETHMLIFSTPVYIPLPGKMQNFLNRICPILNPKLRIEEGRTRAILRDDIPINKFGIIATGGWWEIGNLDTIVRVIDEIAKDAGIEFIPPIL